ncbi:MAG: hypothetical protein LLG06_04590 [Desulfobacteraceae bacterium]|nr:hypothetical protein [Desulfobacteraceae bacterium]
MSFTEHFLRKGVVLAKAETAYGTDATPAAANVILCSVPTHAMAGEKLSRNYMRNSLSQAPFVVGYKKQTISFSCEFKGPNSTEAPDTASYLDALLEACGLVGASGVFAETDNGMLYSPTSNPASMASVTIHYYLDGIRHILTGCRGNATFEFPVGGNPQVNFSFTGLYSAASDSAAPSITSYPDHYAPYVVSAGLVLGTYTPSGVQKISLNLGNKIVEKKDVNSASGLTSLVITGREPKLTLDCDMDTLTNFDPYTIWKDGTLQAISWTSGVKGNRVGISIPKARMDEPAKADRDDSAIWNLTYVPTGNDDEYVIKVG